MTVALVANIARPISSAISTAFSADSYGLLPSYGLLGASANPDAVITALFVSGEQGAWYDPSDLSTMFQDRAGTTSVTADGQPVGLILDKSKGLVLGSELVTNGDFSAGTTGWAEGTGANDSTISVTNGILRATSVVTYGQFYPASALTTVAGKSYKITFDVVAVSAGIIGFRVGTYLSGVNLVPTTNLTTVGIKTFYFTATSSTSYLWFENGATVSGYSEIDNVSVRELPGNHATAPSDAARPLKTSTSAADWINYDAVDDVLNSTFPSSLGSYCTVCRANVGAAPTILTAQTIGTSYADSTDHAGLIIINRALTGEETTDVTAWLTAKGATA